MEKRRKEAVIAIVLMLAIIAIAVIVWIKINKEPDVVMENNLAKVVRDTFTEEKVKVIDGEPNIQSVMLVYDDSLYSDGLEELQYGERLYRNSFYCIDEDSVDSSEVLFEVCDSDDR